VCANGGSDAVNPELEQSIGGLMQPLMDARQLTADPMQPNVCMM
jgi:hypothetical protein